MRASELLAGTKDHLLTHGWTKHNFYDVDGRACLIGALVDSANDGVNLDRALILVTAANATAYGRASQYLTDVIQIKTGSDISISQWNDDPQRSFNEVIDLIDDTIIYAKERDD
jgi:hypothetical protein